MTNKFDKIFFIIFTGILLTFIGIVIYSNFIRDINQEILDVEVIGIVEKKFIGDHNLNKIILEKSREEINISYTSEDFRNTVKKGDSVYTQSGDSTIKIIRPDTVLKFKKIGNRIRNQ